MPRNKMKGYEMIREDMKGYEMACGAFFFFSTGQHYAIRLGFFIWTFLSGTLDKV